MRAQKSFLIAVICLFLGFNAAISLAQPALDDLSVEDLGVGANLVVTSVSGPATAFLKQTISVTYTVKNQGTEASGAYNVGLYLATDKTIDPTTDCLLGSVTISIVLAPGQSKKTTTKVLVPTNGLLSGKYYYGAVVPSSKKASSKQVSIVRYSLTDNNETVTDHKTRLIWQQADDGEYRKWADAKKYCGDLVLGGHSDWRAPRIDELETIVDYNRVDPAIDPVFDGSSRYYWSSNTYVHRPGYAWFVNFNDGSVHDPIKTAYQYVRCVRSGPFWPFDSSTHLQTPSGKPDTVLDTYWGYMWQKGDSETARTWDQANVYCNGLELDGYTDWRLPEEQALLTIVNYTKYDPALSTIFDPRRSDYYWSSSTDLNYPDNAWHVYFHDGDAVSSNKATSYYVRCVRGGSGTSTPPNTVPGAPTGVAATAGNAQATVSFTAPSNGGSPITSYTVTSSPAGKTATGKSSPITVQGLTNGTAYTFTVTASNAIGTGPSSSPSNIVTPIAPGTRYVNNGDGTVTDTKIGLVWQKSDDGVSRSWADAGSYCSNLVLGGHDDWRLPRIDELETIVDYSRYSPSIDPVFDSRSDGYWSGSSDVYDPDYACGVNFSNGYVGIGLETNAYYARCVRVGPVWPFDPLTHLQTPSEKPGTVLDTYWGYMWQKGDSGATLNWAQAKAYCDNLELDGYSDWRLPEIEALQTIVDYTRYGPALSTIFNPCRSDDYWSSSPYVNYPDDAWYVCFDDGNVGADSKANGSHGGRVRCVRGGP